MSFSCPHCSKDIDGVGSQEAFNKRLEEVNAKRKDAEKERDALRATASQAVKLGARAFGFDDDADTLETLELRHKKAVSAGFEGDFIGWLGAENGARADKVAAKFMTATPSIPAPTPPAAPPAKDEPTPSPATPPANRLPSTAPSAAAAPSVSPRLTADQVRAKNKPLEQEYAFAVRQGNKDKASEIKKQMAENWKGIDDAP